MNRAFLLLPRLDPYDAIANDVLGMADALESLDFAVEIIAAGGKLKQRFRKPGAGTWKNASGSDLLIYHYGIAWERGDELFQSFPMSSFVGSTELAPKVNREEAIIFA